MATELRNKPKTPESRPRVSLITVTYNSARTLQDTLVSVRDQEYPAIEHIIVDGGSSDGTLAIVASFPHVAKVISEPDEGIYDAMNKGIQASSGEIIGILNSDDFYNDQYVIGDIVEAMEETGADSAYGDLVYVDPQCVQVVIRTWRSGNFHHRRFLFGWMPPHPTFFVRKTVYDQFGLFQLQLRTAADYELMLRFLFRYRVSAVYIPRVLVRMRGGGQSNASWTRRLIANHEDHEAWRINHLRPYPFTLLLKPVRKIGQFFIRPFLPS